MWKLKTETFFIKSAVSAQGRLKGWLKVCSSGQKLSTSVSVDEPEDCVRLQGSTSRGDKHSAEVQFARAFLEKYNKSQVLTRPRKDEQELRKDNKTKQKIPQGDGNLEERVLWGFLFVCFDF